jgi:hypothetical protein
MLSRYRPRGSVRERERVRVRPLTMCGMQTKEKEDGGAGAAAKEDSSPSSKDEGSGSRGDRKAGLLRSFFMPPVSPRKKESTHPLKMSSDSNGHDFSLDSRTPPDGTCVYICGVRVCGCVWCER